VKYRIVKYGCRASRGARGTKSVPDGKSAVIRDSLEESKPES
jgi:hypothetical protein